MSPHSQCTVERWGAPACTLGHRDRFLTKLACQYAPRAALRLVAVHIDFKKSPQMCPHVEYWFQDNRISEPCFLHRQKGMSGHRDRFLAKFACQYAPQVTLVLVAAHIDFKKSPQTCPHVEYWFQDDRICKPCPGQACSCPG